VGGGRGVGGDHLSGAPGNGFGFDFGFDFGFGFGRLSFSRTAKCS
jgi:hypothetical protein